MDGLRGWEEDYGTWPACEPAVEAPPGAALDDRRTYARAFNAWVARLNGRACPAIQDMEPGSLEGPNSLLLDLRDGADDPGIRLVGCALKGECGAGRPTSLSQIPRDSIVACLASHYPMVLKTAEPIAFDGEHVRTGGSIVMYRGILLPYASAGGDVELIHGMINWREVADVSTTAGIAFEMGRAFAIPPAHAAAVWEAPRIAPAPICISPHPELPLGR